MEFNSNNKTKKNHFVPQTHLRFFESNSKHDIYVYDKATQKIFQTNINNVGAENKLYVVGKEGSNYYNFEEYYTKEVDDKLKYVFQELLTKLQCETIIKPLNNRELRLKLINLIMHQLIRVRSLIYDNYDCEFEKYKKEIETIFEDLGILKYENSEYYTKIKKVLMQEDSYKGPRIQILNDIANNPIVKEILLNKTWIVICNDTDFDFVLGDAPVAIYDFKAKHTHFSNGIDVPTTIIFYPITPKYIISILPNEALPNSFIKENNYKREMLDDLEKIKFLNKIQYDNAERQIFARRREELNYLKREDIL